MRRIAGFGFNSVVHTDGLLRLSQDLPLVIEVVDSDDKIEQIIPRLNELLPGGDDHLGESPGYFLSKLMGRDRC